MKRFVKICLILAAALAVVGIIFTIVAYNMFGARWRDIKNGSAMDGYPFSKVLEKYNQDDQGSIDNNNKGNNGNNGNGVYQKNGASEIITEDTICKFNCADIRDLDLNISVGTCSILPAKDGQEAGTVVLELYPGEQTLAVSLNQGELDISDASNASDILGIDQTAKIYLYVDKEFCLDSLDACVDAGKLSVEQQLSSNEADVEVNAGAVNFTEPLTVNGKAGLSVNAGQMILEKLDCKKDLELNVAAGEMKIMDLTAAGDVQAECDAGALYVETADAEETFNYETSCSMGEIKLNDHSISGLAEDMCKDHGSKQTMKMECNAGSITVKTNKGKK